MKIKFTCPECGNGWSTKYWKWLLTAPFHMFSFRNWKDKRRTTCPLCGDKYWASYERDC